MDFLVCPNVSNAPALTKFSIARLLSACDILVTKSCIDIKLPFSPRSFRIACIVGLPSDLIAAIANLIFPFSTVNSICDSLTSGGRIPIFICLHAYIYPATFDVLSITEVIRAAMNSTG